MPPLLSPQRHLPLPAVRWFNFAGNRDRFTHAVETSPLWTLLGAQSGKFQYAVGGAKAAICLPGEFVLCPPGKPLRRAMLEKTAFYNSFFSWKPAEPAAWAGKHSPRDTARLDSTLAWLRALQGDAAHPGVATWRDHLLSDLLNLCAYESQYPAADEANPPDRLMLKIAHDLQAGLQANEPLGGIARHFGISPFQLSRRFHAMFGVSPAAYRTRLRMKRARLLLIGTAWTVERIAAECGFENAFYFTRVFSREHAQPPSAYRKNANF